MPFELKAGLCQKCQITGSRLAVTLLLLVGLTPVFLLSVKASAESLSAAAPANSLPNVIIIMADDMGWDDVGYHDSDIRTPNIDRIAESGVALDRFYVHPTCSPTRAALLTGKSPTTTNMTRPIPDYLTGGLAEEHKLMPEWFAEVGYQTSLVGKWHLGTDSTAGFPNNRGFDQFYGFLGGFIDYYGHDVLGAIDWQRDGVTVREDGYSTELITREAVRVLQRRDQERPLFMFVSYNAPHGPQAAPQSSIDRYATIADEERREYAAMVDNMDHGIGEILQTLQAQNMAQNTLVLFMSDNGASTEFPANAVSHSSRGSNQPLRGGKALALEGGIRVPAAIWWPGVLQGGAQIRQMITVEDILPTLFEALGLLRQGQSKSAYLQKEVAKFDGVSRWPALLGVPMAARPRFVTGMPMVGAGVIDGEWKLVRVDGPPLPWVDASFELFRIFDDPEETTDLAAEYPDVVARLMPYLAAFDEAAAGGIALDPVAMVQIQLQGMTGNIRFSPYAEAIARRTVTVSGDLVFNEGSREGDDATGVLQYDEDKSYGGYVLLSPKDARATYLIDMQGRAVHRWPLPTGMNVSIVARLLDNGNLLRGIKPTKTAMDKAGPGTRIQELDWQGNVVWQYPDPASEPDRQTRPREDYYRMPNGNTLFMAFEEITRDQALALGATEKRLGAGIESFWPNKLVEVNPEGEIVWQWRFQDHYSSESLGNQSDPGKLDINVTETNLASVNRDMSHSGVLDYDAVNDQILFSARIASELYIVDHSTAHYDEPAVGIEAAKGPAGDFLWRYGNPGNYLGGARHVRADPGDRQLFSGHGANWIPIGMPGAGNVLVHNNGVGRSGSMPETMPQTALWLLQRFVLSNTDDYATIDEINPVTGEMVWRFRASEPKAISGFVGGSAYRLPNGNTHVTSGQHGHIFEVTNAGEVVWEYLSPATSYGAMSRPLAFPFQMNQTSYRFAADHPALRNKNLQPLGTILELEPAASLTGQLAAFLLRHIQSGLIGWALAMLLVASVVALWQRRSRRKQATERPHTMQTTEI